MRIRLFNTYSKIADDNGDSVILAPDVHSRLRTELSYQDGRNTVSLYQSRKPFGWTFPTGLVTQVRDILSEYYPVTIDDWRKHVPDSDVSYRWNPEQVPHSYQFDAVAAAAKRSRGICYMGTGGGKTITGARIIHDLGKRAFVVVISELAWRDTLEGYQKYFIGADIRVWAGDCKELGDITITTIQSLTAASRTHNNLWKHFLDSDIVILDEVHTTSGPGAWGNCILESNAFYRFGMSGTPYRGVEENDILLRAATGKVFYEKKSKDLQEINRLAQSKIVYHRFDMSPDKLIYDPDYNLAIVENEERNNFIAKIAKSSDVITAIGVVQIRHAEILSQLTGYPILHGQLPKKAKIAMRNALKSGSVPGVIATSILTASADYPPLKRFIDASAQQSRNVVIQRKGRVLRLHNEELAEYIGILDEFNDIYRMKARTCIAHFEKEGWEVEIV